MKGLFLMSESLFEAVYKKETQEIIKEKIQILGPVLSEEKILKQAELLREAEVIFSGWGAPVFDKVFLDKVPNLKVIFYAGGTMKHLLTDEVWNRGIRVTIANKANAIPVAEFTLAEILFSLKNGWQLIRQVRKEKDYQIGMLQPVTGAYEATVGLISLSQIGKMTAAHLKRFDLNVIAYDPYISQEKADDYNVKLVSLKEVFEQSDVVSLHTPLLPETKEMIRREHFESMRRNASFINTARGGLVQEQEMIEVLKKRRDLTAVLDVTNPEPPVKDSDLYELENVVLTPHLAGSSGRERSRLGDFMLQELEEYLNNQTLHHEITKESYKTMA